MCGWKTILQKYFQNGHPICKSARLADWTEHLHVQYMTVCMWNTRDQGRYAQLNACRWRLQRARYYLLAHCGRMRVEKSIRRKWFISLQPCTWRRPWRTHHQYSRRVVRREPLAPVCTHWYSTWRTNTVLLTSKRCINAYKPGPRPHATQLVYTASIPRFSSIHYRYCIN